MKPISIIQTLSLLILLPITAISQPPNTTITNGLIHAQIYLPDTANGYYRGTRFDWSGVISSLEYKNHSFHGKWFEKYDPKNHDAIMGPVEEFDPFSYNETPDGGSFVKIGVGKLKKPAGKLYSPYTYYEIDDPGTWKIRTRKRQVEFTHLLIDHDFGYRYRKTVKLTRNKPVLTLIHTLKNMGNKEIETLVYNHNFFMIDKQLTGPAYQVVLPTDNPSGKGGRGLGDLVTFKGDTLSYQRELKKGEQVYFPDLGDGAEMPYKVAVQNLASKASVLITADLPIAKMVYWSASTTVCPEPYIRLKVPPGKSISWTITYEYFDRTDYIKQ